MKKLIAAALFAVLSVSGARSVEASTFTLSSLDIDLRTQDPGLVLWYSNPFSGDIVLNGAGATATKKLFTLGTNEESSDWDDVLLPAAIAVAFSFNQPFEFGGTMAGLTGSILNGYVLWDNPLQLAFGPAGAGLLQITLAHASFGLPGKTDIYGTFKLLKDVPGGTRPPTGVPEPATMLLLATGLGVAALRRRRAA